MQIIKDKLLEKYTEVDFSVYLEICFNQNKKEHIPFVTEHHHILPSSLFPEFSDLKEHKWNGTYLTYENHYKVHSILAEITNEKSLIAAWWGMNNKNTKNNRLEESKEIIGEKLYASLRKKAVKNISLATKNKVVCYDTRDEKFVSIPKENLDGQRYKHKSQNTTVVRLSSGIKKTISIEEFNTGNYDGVVKDTVTVKDLINGNMLRVTTEEFLNNKLLVGTANNKFYFIDEIPMRSNDAENYIKAKGYNSSIHNFERKKNKEKYVSNFEKITEETYIKEAKGYL